MPTNDSIFLKIRELRSTMTPVEQMIAEYVLENKERVPRLSVHALASGSRTSDASVLRFCKTLGYRGYRDFIVGVSTALGSSDDGRGVEQYTDIQPGDDLPTIIKNISLNNCRSIEDTMSVIDHAEIRKAVDLLRRSTRIDFYGVGASGLVCMDAQQKFSRIGKISFAYTDGHSQLTAATLLHKNDVVVMISNSGNTVEILETLAVAREAGASIVAVTRYAKSPLASQADVVLNISTPEITIRSGAMGSRIAMLDIVDILFAGVASEDYRNVKKYLMKTHNVLMTKHKL